MSTQDRKSGCKRTGEPKGVSWILFVQPRDTPCQPGKDEVSRHFFNKCRFLDAMNRLFGSIVITALVDPQNFILHCVHVTMFFVDATRQEA